MLDSGPFDSGLDGGPGPDVPAPIDAGRDVPPTIDAAMPDVPVVVDAPPMVDSGPDPDAGCMEDTSRCDGNMREVCTSAGWVPDVVCELECRESEARASCFDLDPTNVSEPLSAVPPEAVGTITVTDGLWNTDNCDDLDNFWYVQIIPGEIDLCVVAYENVIFQEELRLVGSRALVVVATGTITLDSIIRADGEGSVPGVGAPSGAVVSSSASAYSGGDGGNASVTVLSFDSDGGGGGGGGFGEGGSGASAGGAFGTSVAAGGVGGMPFGTTYIPLRAGGAGGVGSGTGGAGGGGGGAIQFSARGDIFVNSRINVSGGRGSGGTASEDSGGGGGGGAGGTVLFESAATVHFVGAEVLAAGAGGGGGGGCSDGGAGEDEEQNSLVRGGARGGRCTGVLYSTHGRPGNGDGDGVSSNNSTRAGANGGGGGGGSGLVVIRASAEDGTLNGSGHRVSADPILFAVD